MNSCLYVGQVRHRRFTPRTHTFNYRLFYLCLDLDEINSVFDKYLFWSSHGSNLASFSEKDHLKAYSKTGIDGDKARPEPEDLAERARRFVEDETGTRPEGKILLLTHLSYFGFRFNPVSFYYCYNKDNSTLSHIIAEVNNTPWGEQYCYLIPASQADTNKHIRHEESKQFHVSPFMPMDMQYDWRFTRPDESLSVHMQNYREGKKVFDATLLLEREDISSASLTRALARFPFMTMKVVAAIYYQALILLIKRVPVFDHPDNEAPKSVKTL